MTDDALAPFPFFVYVGVQIPAIVWDQTRARVLTMDYEEGVCATDVS